MARVMLSVLGPPAISHDGVEVHVPAQKALGLLFFLALQPGRAFSRSRLVAHLWEESAEREGRNSLSVALSRLRQSLPSLPIVAEGDMLIWVPTADAWVDAAAFLEHTRASASLDDLERAIELWRGPVLDGFAVRDSASYEEWLRLERESWQARTLAVLSRLVTAYEAAGQGGKALAHARRALVIDPLQEHFHRALMRVQARAGDRAAALAQFRACQELLAVELGTEPDPETVALYEAIVQGRLSRRSSMPPVASAPPVLPPLRLMPAALRLIGRSDELARLRQVLAQVAENGRGRLVVIEGEAGIGKSRLVEELLHVLGQEHGARWGVLLGHAYEAERSLPYRPFVDALSVVVPSLDVATLGLPGVWLAEVARLLPDLPVPSDELPAPPLLDPAQQQRRLFEGVARLLAALGSPLLLVLEDIHWADEGTLQLLSFILRHETTRGLLVLATVRSEDLQMELASLLRSLEREGRLTTIHLERLDANATGALLREIIQDAVDYLGERLYAETEGNPLFAVEMVRALQEQGSLRVGLGLTELERVVLPDTIQAVIQSRLAQLDPAGRDFLNAVAIFRRGVDFDQVRLLSGLEEGVALDVLERLLQARLVREVTDPSRPTSDNVVYRFSHDKIRHVVYEGLSAARRRVLHRRAVDVLAASHAPVEELAYHAYLGHIWDRGLIWSEAAAGEAKQVFGYAAATRLYLQALDCLAHLPPNDEQQRREIGLRLQLAQVGFYVQPGALTDWLAPAEAAASALGDAELLTTVRLAQAGALYIQGHFTQALPRLEQLLASPTVVASKEFQAECYNALGRLLVLRGELARARATLGQALPLLEARHSPLPLLVSTNMLAAAIAYMGEFDEALTMARAVLQQADALGDPTLVGVSHAFLEVITQTRGDWAAAVQHGRQAIRLAHEGGNFIYEYVGHVFLGLALARQGDMEGGLIVARQALALADEAQINVLLGRAHGWLGEILLLAQQIDDGIATARRGQAIAREHGFLLEEAICDRVLAQLYTARGEWAAADAALRASIDLLTDLGARPELARAEAALSRLALAQGDRARAMAAYERASQLFTAMGMRADQIVLAHALPGHGPAGTAALPR